MRIPRRSPLTLGVAMMVASALVAATSLTAPPDVQPVTTSGVPVLAAMSTQFRPVLSEPEFGIVPIPAAPIYGVDLQRGSAPRVGAAFPAPPLPEPAPVVTDFAGAIKSTYSAIEPWVRYGFELATYAVGWVPYVGWLSGQIMIFYNFGERIVRSLVFNSADWLWGPLPFGQGVQNILEDSWDALVQLGIDEWNFFLPPLPPLPLTEQQAATPPEEAGGSLKSLKRPDVPSPGADDALAVSAPALDADEDLVLDNDAADAAHPGTTIGSLHDGEVLLADTPAGAATTPDLTVTENADLQAPNKAVDPKVRGEAAPPESVPAKRLSPRLRPRDEASKAHQSDSSEGADSSTKRSESSSRKTIRTERHSAVA